MREEILQRRLVSLARMFQGVDVCGAVFFDEQSNSLNIATNQRETRKKETTEVIFDYLSNIAQNSEEFSRFETHSKEDVENFKEYIRDTGKNLQQDLENISRLYQGQREGTTLYHLKKGYKKDVDRSIAKVTSSIIASYLIQEDERAFPKEFADLFKSPGAQGNIQQIVNKDENVTIHAEMKIIDKLFGDRGRMEEAPKMSFLIFNAAEVLQFSHFLLLNICIK